MLEQTIQISTLGAILGLSISIILIIKKVQPVYSLILGAIIGGLVGGANLGSTVSFMMSGSKDMIPAILRIVTAGILAGVLIQSGAAAKIAETIVKLFGNKYALVALAVSTLFLTSIGVFIDVAVITVAPIALGVAQKSNLSKSAILLAMIGGGKAGNMLSPNPNTLALSDAFNIPLQSLIVANIIPAICGLLVTILLASLIAKRDKTALKDSSYTETTKENIIEATQSTEKSPSIVAALIGPISTVFLLSLRPFLGITIDPLIALPAGGLIGCIAMGKIKNINSYMTYGLQKMTGVAVLLLGTGAISGIIKASQLKNSTIALLDKLGLETYLLAPISGIVMSGATASTTAGATVAATTFAPTLLSQGVSAIAAAAMIHTGATVLDHLPHGSFFHATGGATDVTINNRLKLIPYETLVGLSMVIVSTFIYGIL